MALPDKENFSGIRDPIGGNTKDSKHNPHNKTFHFKSYAQSVRNDQQRDSFDLTPADLGLDQETLPESGKIFLEAIDNHSIILAAAEFQGMKFLEKTLNQQLREHFPKGLGLRTRSTGKKFEYIEINFPTSEDREEALKQTLIINGKTIGVHRTLAKDSMVIRVGISNIPYMTPEFLKPKLVDTFQAYGEILEIGLHHVVDGGWFNGKGFVTLCKLKGDTNFKQLTPQIKGWDEETTLHVVYSQMKPICRRCHTDEHTIGNCPVRRANLKACFICNSVEHLIADCPVNTRNRKRNKLHQEDNRSAKVLDRAILTPALNTSNKKIASPSSAVETNEARQHPQQSASTVNADENTTVVEEDANTHQYAKVDEEVNTTCNGKEDPQDDDSFESDIEQFNEDGDEDDEDSDEVMDAMKEQFEVDTEMNDLSRLPETTVEEQQKKAALLLARRRLLLKQHRRKGRSALQKSKCIKKQYKATLKHDGKGSARSSLKGRADNSTQGSSPNSQQ